MLTRWLAVGLLGARLASAGCAGDCDRDGLVSDAELDASIEVLLEQRELTGCLASDADLDLRTTAVDLVRAIGHALEGCPPLPSGTLSGQVTEAGSGAPLAGVQVWLANGRSCTTDAVGFFSFERLAHGPVSARFTRSDLASSMLRLRAGEDVHGSYQRPMVSAAPAVMLDVDLGGEAGSERARVLVPGGALVTESGESVHGEVDVRVSSVDVVSDEIRALPFSLDEAVDATGERASLQPHGALELVLEQDGEPLLPSAGTPLQAELRIPAALAEGLIPGQALALWVSDEIAGAWVEVEPDGLVQPASDGSGELAVVALLDRASWWLVARPVARDACLSVLVRANGEPLAGAEVVVREPSLARLSTSVTDGEGRACVRAPAGATVSMSIHPNGAAVATLVLDVEVPSGTASCEAGDCLELEPFDLSFGSCLEVSTVDSRWEPRAGLLVRSVPGGSAWTDAEGRACVPAPVDRDVVVQAVGRAGRAVSIEAAAQCALGDCIRTTLGVLLPTGGDSVGSFSARHSASPSVVEPEWLDLSADFSVDDRMIELPPRTWFSVSTEEFGACTVVTGRTVPPDPDALPPPPQPSQFLDAGGCGRVTDGSHAIELEPYAFVPPACGTSVPIDVPSEGWETGRWLTYEAGGGADIGPFAASSYLPERIELLAPDLLHAPPPLVVPGEPLAIEWVVPEDADRLGLGITTTQARDDPPLGEDIVSITCDFDAAAGSFVVSAEATARLLAEPDYTSIGLGRGHSTWQAVLSLRTLELVVVRTRASTGLSRSYW